MRSEWERLVIVMDFWTIFYVAFFAATVVAVSHPMGPPILCPPTVPGTSGSPGGGAMPPGPYRLL